MFRWKRADSQALQSCPRVREGSHEEVGFDVCRRPQGGELGTTKKRVWANHEGAQLCQILLGKQVASRVRTIPGWWYFPLLGAIWVQLGSYQVTVSQRGHPGGLGGTWSSRRPWGAGLASHCPVLTAHCSTVGKGAPACAEGAVGPPEASNLVYPI